MSEIIIGITSIGILILLFLTGIELSFAIGIIGFAGYAYLVSGSAALNLLAKDIMDTFTSYGLTVIPLFVLMGSVADLSGTAKKMYNAAYRFVGHIPGGLAMTTVVGATLFKAMSGSTFATIVAFSGIAVPEMMRYGYNRKLATGLVATVGTLGIILPPSVVLIIFGLITEQSIGRLFLAGLVPGIAIAGLFMVLIFAWVRINPELAPRGEQFTWKEKVASLPDIVWALVVFCIVLGGLMKGFFSPTEAGSIGLAAVLLLAFTKEKFRPGRLFGAVAEALQTSCMTIMLIACSTVFGHFLTITEIPMNIADWTASLPIPPIVVMIVIILIYLIGGSFIDDLAFMILATPIFFPVVLKLGFNPIWFAMVISITIMIGVVIPPIAIAVFIVRKITGEPFHVIYQGVYPFLSVLVAALVLLFIFPGIVTFLPDMVMGKG